jgi:dihydrofolate reductase
MKSIVVAYDQAHGIGADNDLLWQRNLPADLAHFKRITTGGSNQSDAHFQTAKTSLLRVRRQALWVY